MKNIIILTSGLSGSSVVTHLLFRAGYWTGTDTCKKSSYDTHENTRLVELNQQLLKLVNYDVEYMQLIRPEKIGEIEALYDEIDLSLFQQFIHECEQHSPWILKDPRLWITLPFWIKLINTEKVQFIFVDRKVSQRWISELLKKNIQTVDYSRSYSTQIEQLCKQLLQKYDLQINDILYDDLIVKPEKTIQSINHSLGCSLEIDDLKQVYTKPLKTSPRGLKSLVLAILIYLKNYQEGLR